MSKQSSPTTRKSLPVSKIVCLAVVVLSLAFGGFFFFKYQDLSSKYQELTQSQEDKNKEIIEQVSKLYNVPSYEQENPTIFYVKDKDQLGGSEFTKKFFETAQNNDVVIAYKNADISIIYRPGEKKIIKTDNYANFIAAASPISISLLAPDAAQAAVQGKISSQFKNAVVSNKNLPKTTITTGVVYATSPDFNDAAKQLAQLLGYNVGALPAGEDAPAEGVDIVILAPTAQ